jgi:hypothetical protein
VATGAVGSPRADVRTTGPASVNEATPVANRAEKRAAEHVQRRPARPARNGYVKKLRRCWERNQRWLDRHRANMAKIRGPERECPPAVPLEVWRIADEIMLDTTGRAARIHLARLPPLWAAQVRRAALGLDDGEVTRGWSSERARAIVVTAIVCARAKGRVRRGDAQWPWVVKGYTRGVFAKIAQGTRLAPVHVNTIRGVHCGGRAQLADESAQLGYLDALRRTGFLKWQRLPAERVEPWERWTGRDGRKYAANRYRLCNPDPYDGQIRDDVRSALLQLARRASSADSLRLRPRAPHSSGEPHVPAESLEPPPAPD